MTPERRTLDQIVAYLKSLRDNGEPIYWLKAHGGPMQRAGVPDLLVCFHGRFVALEAKSPTGKATALQKHTLGLIAGAFGKVAVVRSVEQVAEILEEVKHERR